MNTWPAIQADELRDLRRAGVGPVIAPDGTELAPQGGEVWIVDCWRYEAPVPAKAAHRRRYRRRR